MNELVFTHKLDIVLKYIVNGVASDDNSEFDKIGSDLSKFVTKGELDSILRKLKKDGFITFTLEGRQVDEIEYETRFSETFEGNVLNELGGYTQRERDKLQNETNRRTYDERMETYAKNLALWTENLTNRTADLMWWTRLVAIGAVGLVIWEMIQYFFLHPESSC